MSGRRQKRFLVAVGIALLALNVRPALIVISPLLPWISLDLGMSPAVAGVLGAAPPLAFAVLGWMTPTLARITGYERLAWIALVVMGVAQLARLVTDVTAVFVAFSFLTYAAMGVGNVLLPPLVKIHFPTSVGVFTGMYIMLVSVGTAVPAFLAVPVADVTSWQVSAGVWGVFSLAVVYPWVRVSWGAKRREVRRASGRPQDAPPIMSLLFTPLAWGLLVVFGMNSLNAYAMMTWLPTLLVEAGVTADMAGAYLSLFAMVAIPLALLVPWATVRARRSFPLLALFAACYASGYCGLMLAPTSATPLWVILAGAGPGTFPLTLTLVNLRSSTVGGAAALSGTTQGLGYLLAGAGPFVVGLLREMSGDWSTPLQFLLCTLLFQLAAGYLVSRPGTIEVQLARRRRSQP